MASNFYPTYLKRQVAFLEDAFPEERRVLCITADKAKARGDKADLAVQNGIDFYGKWT